MEIYPTEGRFPMVFSMETLARVGSGELEPCSAYLAESLPEGVIYPPSAPSLISTSFAWDSLIFQAKHNISIASFYWTMLRDDVYNSSSAYQGEKIFNKLLEKSKEINVTIVTSGPQATNNDLDQLIAAGAKVKYLDVTKLLTAGVQHAKLWTVDNQHGYIGSANMDWRALTQVKELGIFFKGCPRLASDLSKIIGAFGHVAEPGIVFPINWTSEFTTTYNRTNPMKLLLNGVPASVYISMSPPAFRPPEREDDLDTIIHIIDSAQSFVYVAVMEFQALVKYYSGKPDAYWPDLSNALIRASLERGVEVRILVSHWAHTSPKLRHFMKAIRTLHGVNGASLRIRFFVVPVETPEQRAIPFARVNHNKYMVTDKTLYVGTSNWSGDYFKFTGGAGFVVECDEDYLSSTGAKCLRKELEEVFLRDWNSVYTDEL
nr:phospholipase d3 [Hymenolepis microstoma]